MVDFIAQFDNWLKCLLVNKQCKITPITLELCISQRLQDPARGERIVCLVLISFEVHWRRSPDLAGDWGPIAWQESCNKRYFAQAPIERSIKYMTVHHFRKSVHCLLYQCGSKIMAYVFLGVFLFLICDKTLPGHTWWGCISELYYQLL